MGRVCGNCARYKRMPFCENICTKTGKVVPYLAQRDCFEEKDEVFTNSLAKNTKQMEENATTKVCSKCGRELPLSAFGHHARTKDGLQPVCRECRSAQFKGVKKNMKPTDLEACHENQHEQADGGLGMFTDIELKNELISRGWDVVCTRTITL